MIVWEILDKKSKDALAVYQYTNYGTKIDTPPIVKQKPRVMTLDDEAEEDGLEEYAKEMRKAPNR